jgi:hypothetical protein
LISSSRHHGRAGQAQEGSRGEEEAPSGSYRKEDWS